DMVQTTYGRSNTVNSKRIFLDGTELTAYRDEIRGNQTALQWTVPRFTIPYTSLQAGNHMLTFVAANGEQSSSTVHV
ncbi:hypothetical protein MXD81_27420, partial [Microbacteriaceae bacterium K1510]|nr:hypothetical protein [Microbacteriaceae bacterium K1510]